MAIRYTHEVDPRILGDLAYRAGAGQREQRDREMRMRYQSYRDRDNLQERLAHIRASQLDREFQRGDVEADTRTTLDRRRDRLERMQINRQMEELQGFPDGMPLTAKERMMGELTDDGNRIRESNRLTPAEKAEAIRRLSTRQRIDPDSFKTPEQLQQEFAQQMDQRIHVRDGVMLVQQPDGSIKNVPLPTSFGGVDPKDVDRAYQMVQSEETYLDEPMSEAQRQKRAMEILQSKRAIMEQLNGQAAPEQGAEGTGSVEFVDPNFGAQPQGQPAPPKLVESISNSGVSREDRSLDSMLIDDTEPVSVRDQLPDDIKEFLRPDLTDDDLDELQREIERLVLSGADSIKVSEAITRVNLKAYMRSREQDKKN